MTSPHDDLPTPERLDALIDGDPPRDQGERDALALAATLRQATPGASDDLRRRLMATAAASGASPAPRPPRRSWLPWGAGAAVAGLGAAVVAGVMLTGSGGGDTRLAAGGDPVPTAESALDMAAPESRAVGGGAPQAAAPPPPAPAPSSVAPAAPSRSKAGAEVRVRVPIALRARRIDAGLAQLRRMGLVVGQGDLTVSADGAVYRVLFVPRQGSAAPPGLAGAVRAAVGRPAAAASPARSIGATVTALARTPDNPALRSRLARLEKAGGATPPPISSGPPTIVAFVLPR